MTKIVFGKKTIKPKENLINRKIGWKPKMTNKKKNNGRKKLKI